MKNNQKFVQKNYKKKKKILHLWNYKKEQFKKFNNFKCMNNVRNIFQIILKVLKDKYM